MKTLTNRMLVGALVFAGAIAAQAADAPAKIEIEILHTNDLHGYLRPSPEGKGGAGAMAAKIAAARARAKTDPAYDVLVIDSGDIFGGGAEDGLTKGAMMIDFLAGAGYDVYVPGNHDFGYGLKTLTDGVAKVRGKGVKVLAANITGANASQVCEPDAMFTLKGVKIGVIGATTPGTSRMNLDENYAGLDFPEPAAPIKARSEALKKAGANIIILASHMGLEQGKYVDDKKLAAGNADLKVIIGGHSHTAMDRPFIANKAVIVQSGSQGKFMGSLTIAFDGTTKQPIDENKDGVVDHKYTLADLNRESGAHPLADELKTKYWDPIQAQLDETLGNGEIGLYRKFYKTEGQLGNFLADSMLEASGGAQIELNATSELRADLRKGDITLKDVFQVVPFDNEIVRFKCKGSVIKDVIDSVYGEGRRMIMVAGMNVKVDSRKPEGTRVLSVTIAGKELDPNAFYDLATTDFVAQGKGGFKQFNVHDYTKTGVTNREAMIKRIKKFGTITSDSIQMRRLTDLALEEEIGRVTRSFGTDMSGQQANLYDIVASGVLGTPARGDIALIDTFGIHWKLSEKFPVVKKDLFELVAYDNQLMSAQIKGDQLQKLFKQIVAAQDRRLSAYIAGGTLLVNAGQAELLVGGKPVDAAKTYTLVTYDHLLAGPRGFEALGNLHLQAKPLGLTMREAIEKWIRTASPIGNDDFPEKPGVVVGGQNVGRTANRIKNFGKIGDEAEAEEPAHTHTEE